MTVGILSRLILFGDKRKEEIKSMDKDNNLTKVCNIKPVSSLKEQFKEYCCTKRTRISTGYLNFDVLLGGGLTDDLYIFGAPTSCGKSAFWMSIAQNISKEGIKVLYFSLEMSAREHIARGVSFISYDKVRKGDADVAYTAQEILKWKRVQETNEFEQVNYSCFSQFADKYFSEYADNLYIIEGGIGGMTANRISDMVVEFCNSNSNEEVVVIVDYLQIIAQPDKVDRKREMDNIVGVLKNISMQLEIPVVCISSIGRNSYGKRVSSGSFKESGDIEYGGGVCLGFNWCGGTVKADENDKMLLKQLAREGCRLMELDFLKSRNGENGTRARFKYHPAFNCFEEIRE